MLYQSRQQRDVRVQFNLAWQVEEDEVLFAERLNGSGEEIEVLEEEFEAIDQAAVRAKGHLFHDIFEADEVFDVEKLFAALGRQEG